MLEDSKGDELQLLCDQMLRGVGKWLRAAGYDTLVADETLHDQQLIEIVERENRVLLTCDLKLAERTISGKGKIIHLTSNMPPQAMVEVQSKTGISCLLKPFSRCLVDNTVLIPLDEEQISKLSAQTRALPGPFMYCPLCKRSYWPGSHVKRMMRKLENWHEAACRL